MNKIIAVAHPVTYPDNSVTYRRLLRGAEFAAWLYQTTGEFTLAMVAHNTPVAAYLNSDEERHAFRKKSLEVCTDLAVLMVDEWEQSKGVQAEIRLFKNLGRPIRYYQPVGASFEEVAK